MMESDSDREQRELDDQRLVAASNLDYEKWLKSVSEKPVVPPFLPLLPAFERGDFHDCTIRVGCDLQNSDSSFKDFKCHKLILIACSPMFETMFFSNFREATLGRDDPILLDRIDPIVFERAMRFVYSQGQETDFECVEFGIQLYKFAHEMQIELLVQALENFFKEPSVEDVFLIFDLYQLLEYHAGREHCKEVLEEKTSEAINSEGWLSISLESISEFLSMERLHANEVDLLRALLRWAEFQSQQEEDDINSTLLCNFLSGFRYIRLASISQQDMAQLFQEKLGEMLSNETKCSILMSIDTQNWNLMPEYLIPFYQNPRKSPYSICYLDFDEKYNPPKSEKITGKFTYTFTFQINKRATMAGLKIDWYGSSFISEMTLVDPRDQTVVGNGNPDVTFHYRNKYYTQIDSTSLDANTSYLFNVHFPSVDEHCLMYSLTKKELKTSDGLTVTIFANDMFDLIDCLLFEREKPYV